jgi:hypothetical protein
MFHGSAIIRTGPNSPDATSFALGCRRTSLLFSWIASVISTRQGGHQTTPRSRLLRAHFGQHGKPAQVEIHWTFCRFGRMDQRLPVRGRAAEETQLGKRRPIDQTRQGQLLVSITHFPRARQFLDRLELRGIYARVVTARRLAKDHKQRAVFRKLQRHGGATLGLRERRGIAAAAGDRIPELGLLAQ